jgi:hypothetical protein
MWMLFYIGSVRLKKSAVTKRTVGGIERHIKESLIKAGLGSVRLAHFFFFTHWELLLKAEEGVGEALNFLGVPA